MPMPTNAPSASQAGGAAASAAIRCAVDEPRPIARRRPDQPVLPMPRAGRRLVGTVRHAPILSRRQDNARAVATRPATSTANAACRHQCSRVARPQTIEKGNIVRASLKFAAIAGLCAARARRLRGDRVAVRPRRSTSARPPRRPRRRRSSGSPTAEAAPSRRPGSSPTAMARSASRTSTRATRSTTARPGRRRCCCRAMRQRRRPAGRDHDPGSARLHGRQRQAEHLRAAGHVGPEGGGHLEQCLLPAGPGASNNAGSYINAHAGGRRLRRRRHARPAVPLRVGGHEHRPGTRRLGRAAADQRRSATPSARCSAAMPPAPPSRSPGRKTPPACSPARPRDAAMAASGSHVSGGTNIWYTHAPSPNGTTLRANIAQLSDNQPPGTGQPGASRPNLQISGSTAVVALRRIGLPRRQRRQLRRLPLVPVREPRHQPPGTIVSDVTKNARRVRFVLQGAAAAGTSNLRTCCCGASRRPSTRRAGRHRRPARLGRHRLRGRDPPGSCQRHPGRCRRRT